MQNKKEHTSIGSCFLATRYRAFPDCVKMHNAACASSWSQKKLLNLLIVTTHADVQWESLNCLAISAALSCSGLAEKQIRIPAFYLATTTLGSIILTYLDQRFEHEDVLLRNRPPRADGHLAHPPDQLVQAPCGRSDQLGFEQYVPICTHLFLQNEQ